MKINKGFKVFLAVVIMSVLLSSCSSEKSYSEVIVDGKLDEEYSKVTDKVNGLVESLNDDSLSDEQLDELDESLKEFQDSLKLDQIDLEDEDTKKIHEKLEESMELIPESIDICKEIIPIVKKIEETDVEGKEDEYNENVDQWQQLADELDSTNSKIIDLANEWGELVVDDYNN
jgi:hypothetical protein